MRQQSAVATTQALVVKKKKITQASSLHSADLPSIARKVTSSSRAQNIPFWPFCSLNTYEEIIMPQGLYNVGVIERVDFRKFPALTSIIPKVIMGISRERGKI